MSKADFTEASFGTVGSGQDALLVMNNGSGAAMVGRSTKVKLAWLDSANTDLPGCFIGDIEVTGDIRLVNPDCAEDFMGSWGGEISARHSSVNNLEYEENL